MNRNAFMMLVVILAAAVSFETRARASDGRSRPVGREIVLEEVRGKRAAQRQVMRAAIALQYRAALGAPNRRVAIGPVMPTLDSRMPVGSRPTLTSKTPCSTWAA